MESRPHFSFLSSSAHFTRSDFCPQQQGRNTLCQLTNGRKLHCNELQKLISSHFFGLPLYYPTTTSTFFPQSHYVSPRFSPMRSPHTLLVIWFRAFIEDSIQEMKLIGNSTKACRIKSRYFSCMLKDSVNWSQKKKKLEKAGGWVGCS